MSNCAPVSSASPFKASAKLKRVVRGRNFRQIGCAFLGTAIELLTANEKNSSKVGIVDCQKAPLSAEGGAKVQAVSTRKVPGRLPFLDARNPTNS